MSAAVRPTLSQKIDIFNLPMLSLTCAASEELEHLDHRGVQVVQTVRILQTMLILEGTSGPLLAGWMDDPQHLHHSLTNIWRGEGGDVDQKLSSSQIFSPVRRTTFEGMKKNV